MKRLAATLLLALAGLAPASAQAAPSDYGIASAEAFLSSAQAGGHPDFTTFLALEREADGSLPATSRDVIADLSPGLLVNPTAVPTCAAAQFLATDVNDPSNASGCPQGSQVGLAEVVLFNEGGTQNISEPVFNVAAAPGEPARLGFFANFYPVLIDTRLRPEDGYAGTAASENIGSLIPLVSARLRTWGVPADESHDAERITAYEAVHGGHPETSTGTRSAGLAPTPYTLSPTRCGVPQGVLFTATPYALPELHSTLFAPLNPSEGCGLLDFDPSMSVAPTTPQAETGTGLDVHLEFPTAGFERPDLLAQAAQRRVRVTLPEGVTVNPSQAVGLGVCAEADLARETYSSGPDEGCPESSKIGKVTAKSPLLEETAEGGLFIAKPHENPFGSLLALYLVLKVPERGVIVKLAGKVEPDPKTGQLITTFGEPGHEIPQLPVESFHLHFREGARSPLVTPPHCGTYESDAVFTSWAGHTVTTHPSFEITSGVNGGSCPSESSPFAPGFVAGSLNNAAGAYSPFAMRITRGDGEQDLSKFSAVLPPGVVGKIAGIPWCGEAGIARAKARTGENGGREELRDPSCPAASLVGHTVAGAGVGSQLTYVGGTLYLAGPYKGAPLSVVAIVPAVAGPFDAGTVVVRVGLDLNPVSGVVEADGAASDPIPHILKGIPLNVRDLRVSTDRPAFTLNATSCAEERTFATLWGAGTALRPLPPAPVGASARYQAAGCASLGFSPKLGIKLKGGVRRGAHPALKAVVTPRPGQANFARAAVTLPRSAFLDQAHIRTICTRVQFAAGPGHGALCPEGARYGYARAWSPLLDEPAQGPVYLRSSENKLPDLVIALRGPASAPFSFELSSRIDSVRGGIRSTFTAIPDLPVSRFILDMQGGKKGLIVNSRHLCHKPKRNRARANLLGQNGRISKTKPRVIALTCAKRRKAKRARAKRSTGHVSRASAVG